MDYSLSAFKTQTTDPKLFSIGGKYAPEGMPFYIDVAYEKHDDMFGFNKVANVAGGTSSSDDAFQIGGGYTFGPATIHVRFESLSYETDAVGTWERDALWFGVKWSMPTGYIGAEFGKADEADCTGVACTDTGATMIGVGYFHNLSKQSQMQVIYGRTDNDANARYLQIGAPLSGAGADHQSVTLAIKHTF